LNLRPLGYEPNELPGCSTAHTYSSGKRSGLHVRDADHSKEFLCWAHQWQRPHKVGVELKLPAW